MNPEHYQLQNPVVLTDCWMFIESVWTYFLAGTVLVRFHSLSVWSSDTVTRHGSTGWKASARTPSKWLRSVYLGFQVFLNEDSLLDGS